MVPKNFQGDCTLDPGIYKLRNNSISFGAGNLRIRGSGKENCYIEGDIKIRGNQYVMTGFTLKGRYLHRSSNDTAFLQQVRDTVPPNEPLLVHAYDEALEGLRIMFYCDDNAKVLHNLTYLKDDRLTSNTVYVLARGKFQSENT